MKFNHDYCYMTYVGELREKYRQRAADISRMLGNSDAQAIRARGEEIRQVLARHLLDAEFEDVAPDAAEVGKLIFPEYTIEKLHIAGTAGMRIPINLYLPRGTDKKVPAVLIGMGHWYDGKVMESNQRLCAQLARMGIAAITFDPLFQGERCPYSRDMLQKLFGSNPEDIWMVDLHMQVGNPAYMLSKNVGGLFVYELRRVLDYLCGRDEIDAERIAAVGQSGGGTQICYLAALEPRIRAYAPVQCLSRLSQTLENGIGDCEQSLAGISAEIGMEQGDPLWAALPKPVLHCAGSEDYFAIEGVRSIQREMAEVYRVLGKPEGYTLEISDCRHELNRETREFIYRWLNAYFSRSASCVEQDSPILNPEALRCLEKNQHVSPTLAYRNQLEKIKSSRPVEDKDLRSALTALLHPQQRSYRIEPLPAPEGWNYFNLHVEESRSAFCRLRAKRSERLLVAVVPGEICLPENADASVLYVAPWAIEAAYRKKGMGYDLETCLFNISTVLGECICAQRVRQLLAAVDYASDLCGASDIRAIGANAGAMTVLLAACVDERFHAPLLADFQESFDAMFDGELHFIQETNILPGLLACADLPRLCVLTHARRVDASQINCMEQII